MSSDRKPGIDQISCKVLADLLVTEWRDMRRGMPELWPHETKLLRQLMLADLAGHASLLLPSERANVWSNILPTITPTVFADLPLETREPAIGKTLTKPLFSRSRLLPKRDKPEQTDIESITAMRTADIIILTILPVERDAVLATFGQNPRRKEDFSDRGNFYYRVPFKSSRYDIEMTAWLTMIGKPRNVPCAIFVGRLGTLFRFQNIVLMGIAGGNRARTKLGDVVTSTEVLDNEGGVDELNWWVKLGERFFGRPRHQPRVQIHRHDRTCATLLRNFTAEVPEWHSDIKRVVSEGNKGSLVFDPSDSTITSEHKAGLVQAGERLKRDGSLPQTSRNFHDKLYAVEMEGSGFAQACESEEYDWIVFRGISDYGDPEKRDKKQAYASVAAATLLKQFLESNFQSTSTEKSAEF